MTREEAIAISKPLWVSDDFATMAKGKAMVTVRMFVAPKTEDKPPYDVGDTVFSKERWQMKGDKVVYYTDASTYYRHHSTWRGASNMPPSAIRSFLRVTAIERCRLQDNITLEECSVTWGWNEAAVETVGVKEMYKNGWDGKLRGKSLELYGFDTNPMVWKITLVPLEMKDGQLIDASTETFSYNDLKQIECSLIQAVTTCDEQVERLSKCPSSNELYKTQVALWKKNKDDYTALIEKVRRIERNM